MKKTIFSRIITIVFAVVVLFQLGGFTTIAANAQTIKSVKVTSVTLNTNSLNLLVGKTGVFKITVLPTNASNKKVTWKSSNARVAKVDSSGKVTAVSVGTAVITCTANDGSGKIAKSTVTVLSKDTVVPQLGQIKYLTQINSGKDTTSFTMKWTKATDNVTPQNKLRYYLYEAEGKEYGNNISQWEKNAKLLNKGGNLDISSLQVTGINSKKTYYFKLIVEDGSHNKAAYVTESRRASNSSVGKVTSVALNTTKLSLTIGQTGTLKPTVLPTNASNKSVTWKSSNAKIAKVDANGKVTAVGTGTAIITCTANDGSGKSATCTVNVYTLGSFVTKPQLLVQNNDILLSYKINQAGTYTLTGKIYTSNDSSDGYYTWDVETYKSGDVEKISISDVFGELNQGEYIIFEVTSKENKNSVVKSEKITVTKSGTMNIDTSKITATGSGDNLILKSNQNFEKGIYSFYGYENNATDDCTIAVAGCNGNTSSLTFENQYSDWKDGIITSMQISRIYDISIAANGSATCKVETSKEFVPSK